MAALTPSWSQLLHPVMLQLHFLNLLRNFLTSNFSYSVFPDQPTIRKVRFEASSTAIMSTSVAQLGLVRNLQDSNLPPLFGDYALYLYCCLLRLLEAPLLSHFCFRLS